MEQLRLLGQLTDASIPMFLSLPDGSPCLPMRLNLRNCPQITDVSLRLIADLLARDQHKNLQLIDLRGSYGVTAKTVYALFGVQTPRRKDCRTMGPPPKDRIVEPAVRVRLRPLSICGCLEVERIIKCATPLFSFSPLRPCSSFPASMSSEARLARLEEIMFEPSLLSRNGQPTETSAAAFVNAIEARSKAEIANWKDIDVHLCEPPSDPRQIPLTLCQQHEIEAFGANVRREICERDT
jgi:hypothetical protein